MSDEEVIRRRLLIDGDGTGDDRRINVLLKSFMKWVNNPDSDNILHERMLCQLAQCEFAQKKSRFVSSMSQEELRNYEELSKEIEIEIEEAKKDIEQTKIELEEAKRVRKNRIEYDVLAKVINEQPDRVETNAKLDTLRDELGSLKEKSEQLERKLEMRRKQFHVLISSIHSLQGMLDEVDEEIMDVSLENYEDTDVVKSPKKETLDVFHLFDTMLETKSTGLKDTDPEKKVSFLTELLKTESLDSNLLKLLYQFLLTFDFEATAKCLLKEANKLGYNKLDESFSPKDAISEDVCSKILSEFRSKDWKLFFKLWNDSIPESIKSTIDYKTLTMKLRVHFAILPMRTEQSKKFSVKKMQNDIYETEDSLESDPDVETAQDAQKAASMNQLEQYLKTDGRNLVNYNSFIPFFALPYMENPINDSTVSHIFSTSWVDDLTVTLKIFLVKNREIVTPRKSHPPSPNTSKKSLTIPNSILYNEDQIEQNLKILDSLDFEDTETRKGHSIVSLKNERIESLKTHLECLRNDGMQIIPNDRDIPVFFEEEEPEEEFPYERKTTVQIKSTQTRIQGIKNTTNLLATDELSQPVRVVDPKILFRTPKKSQKKYEEHWAWTMSRFQNVHGNYQRLKMRFYQLHSDYHKLTEVAGELTRALENSVRGNPVSLQRILESCILIFPDLFNKSLRVDSETELFKSVDEVSKNRMKITHRLDSTPLSPKSIDFKKIKLHLACGSLKTKLLLLQALRWKITLSQQGERDEVIHEYIKNDLLEIRGNIASSTGKQILPYILYPIEGPREFFLEQSAARFLNTLASLRCGRDYLSIGTTILNAIVECLNSTNNDAYTYDMLLAMLQKLSVRKQQRLNMIEAGLVEWLIHHLNVDGCKMSPYRLKYITALLMNLSLHSKAQNKVSSEAQLVISLLTDLLLTEHHAALPFISGALSNFLLNRNINEEGKKLGLESVLKYYRKRSSAETREYLDHIIKLHNREDAEIVEPAEMSDNDNDEYDLIEDELDEDDPVQNEAGELAGEMFLASFYSLSANSFSSSVEKLDSQHGGLQQILHNREMISRFSKAKNQIRLRPIYKKSCVEENYKRIDSSEYSLTQGNSSMINLIEYTSLENFKQTEPNFNSYSPPLHDVTTLYRQKHSTKKSRILDSNSKSSFQNQNSKYSYETSDGISKEKIKMTMNSSSTITSANVSLQEEAPDVLSSIAFLEESGIIESNLKEEEAFIAKPKLQRTPPHTTKLKNVT
ncbi:uncharacterized protein LOC117169891 [Belonocnema kinseyi]|uniref:uncharacterized protein LOC117169891 n=1 Tax=Belonocnema kinseyi TaxID=2817044 RepID=UPI00143E0D54|nr:uncharacterized protein LOC117169891 [Belonocnema kinseyi]